MTWSDIPRNPSRKMLRQFAGAWLVFFLAWAGVQWFARGHHGLGAALAVAALVVGVPSLVHPPLLRWLFVGWMTLAFPIGWMLSQVLLAVLYFAIFTPVAFFFRLKGRDELGLKSQAGKSSFWLQKETPLDVRRYFRQY